MQIITLDFGQDLNKYALSLIQNRSIMIFPTRKAEKDARLEYEKDWQLLDIQWTSMEDFKESLCYTQMPLISDDKRLLALYQVLEDEDKEYFHISVYDDLVGWGINLFDFLDEHREAGYDALNLMELTEKETLLKDWQYDHISRIAEIVKRYHSFIYGKGFSDRIFVPLPQSGEIPFAGKRIVIVNQFYYSPREEELLRRCKDAGNEIILLYHGVAPKDGAISVSDFDVAQAWEVLENKPDIRISHCVNEDAAALDFIRSQSAKEDAAIIDSRFWASPYSAFFPPELVCPPRVFLIVHSNWFRLMSLLRELASNASAQKGYVPLSIIMRYCLDLGFNQSLLEGWDEAKQELLRKEIFKLCKDQVLYLDIEEESCFGLSDKEGVIYGLVERLFALLKKVFALSSIEELIELIDKDLNPIDYCSKEEMDKSDILEEIWKSLANFSTAERLGIVQDWSAIFDNPAVGIFGLWLDFVKSQRFGLSSDKPQCGWEVTNLFDARNRSFKNLAILQCVEGVLPQNPAPVWLLSEAQRKRFGFLAYDTIRAWDRYYFMRLVFLAKEVDIYTYSNVEENIHPSSFAEELCTFVEGLRITREEESLTGLDIKELFYAFPPLSSQESMDFVRDNDEFLDKADADFFHLPAAPDQDFKDSDTISFGSYALTTFVKNPFVWYIENHRRIEPLETEPEETLRPLLFGSLMHKYFELVLGQSRQRVRHADDLRDSFTNKEKLKDFLLDLIESGEFRYKIPKNYNSEFLSEIISDRLVLSLQEFYYSFMKSSLEGGSFELIPENADIGVNAIYSRILEPESSYSGKYQIQLNGRADLRIATDDIYYIVDFKTGGADHRQLAFYLWLYKDMIMDSKAELSFWKILDMDIDRDQKLSDTREKRFYEAIFEGLTQCVEKGYEAPNRGDGRDLYIDITRSDLRLQGAEQ